MLTIITPCYNAEPFIGKCILNVAKSYVIGIEHLIMDGGSTDGTLAIARELARQFCHVSVYSQPDNGQSQAMNRGIRLAKHQAISFLNVDDEYFPDALPYVAGLIQDMPELFFIVGNCQLRDSRGEDLSVNKPTSLCFDRLLLFSRRFPYPSNPSAYFYDKRIHDMVGYYDEGLHYTMDLEFILRMSSIAKVVHVDKLLGVFTLHRNGKTSSPHLAQAELRVWSSLYIRALSPKDRLIYKFKKGIEVTYEFFWILGDAQKRLRGKLRALRLKATGRSAHLFKGS